MLFVLMLSIATTATDVKKELKALESAYDDTEFEQVTAKGGKLLKNSKLKQTDKKRLLEMIAFSYFYLNKKVPAEATLRELFALDPYANVDKRKVTPELGVFFEEVRTRAVPQDTPPPEPDSPPPENGQGTPPQDNSTHPITVAPDNTTTQTSETAPATPPPSPFRWYGLIPCGIGHFALGDYGIGAMFLGLELALIGTSVTFFWLRTTQRVGADQYANEEQANIYQWVQNGAAFAAIAVGIISMIDGGVGAPYRVQKRKMTTSVGITPMPGGGAMSLSLSF